MPKTVGELRLLAEDALTDYKLLREFVNSTKIWDRPGLDKAHQMARGLKCKMRKLAEPYRKARLQAKLTQEENVFHASMSEAEGRIRFAWNSNPQKSNWSSSLYESGCDVEFYLTQRCGKFS